jgi:GNAT superfamily N-acetyltransferase
LNPQAFGLVVAELDTTHLGSLHAMFDAASSSCFCRYWHFTGTKNDWLDRCANRPEENFRELATAVEAREPAARGLVALADPRALGSGGDEPGMVVGWMKLTARQYVPKLRSLPVYRSLDLGSEATTYSIGCFLIHPKARGRGVARALVEAAPSFVRSWGGQAIEAYPRRSTEPLYPEEAWQGPESVFVSAGFEAVHDIAPYPVYRMGV